MQFQVSVLDACIYSTLELIIEMPHIIGIILITVTGRHAA